MSDMQSTSPHFDPGDLVTDRENADVFMLVVDVSDDRADDVEVAHTGSTVADYNPAYPADDPSSVSRSLRTSTSSASGKSTRTSRLTGIRTPHSAS